MSVLSPSLKKDKTTIIVPDYKSFINKVNGQWSTVNGHFFDLSLAGYSLNPELRNYSIDKLAVDWLGNLLPTESINWAGRGAEICNTLYEILEKELKEKKLYKLYSEVEIPLAKILAEMERTGVLIDKEYFHSESKKLELRLKELEENIYSVTGERF